MVVEVYAMNTLLGCLSYSCCHTDEWNSLLHNLHQQPCSDYLVSQQSLGHVNAVDPEPSCSGTMQAHLLLL